MYVVGHGIQLNKRGAVVLLHDFATGDRPLLHGAIDVVGCRDAMDENGNAGHQVWFSDACRQRPESEEVREPRRSGPTRGSARLSVTNLPRRVEPRERLLRDRWHVNF